MKKLLFILTVPVLIAGCRKDRDDVVSEVVPVSYPTITFTPGQYNSIPVGGTMPTITATAYDSVLKMQVDVVLSSQEGFSSSAPGIYVITGTAANENTFSTSTAAFIVVTDVADSFDLSGAYSRIVNNVAGEPVNITRLAKGLYVTDDVGGAAALEVAAVFGHLQDTVINLPSQPTSNGELDCLNERLEFVSTGPQISWSVDGAGFGTALRTFRRQ